MVVATSARSPRRAGGGASAIIRPPTASQPSTSAPLNLRAISHPSGYHYLVSTPPSAGEDPLRHWPLILFLHGAAERGAQVTDVARQGLPKLLSNAPELTPEEMAMGRDVAERFVVVAPQCGHYEVWNEEQLLRLLAEVSAQFSIDPRRVYLTGLSMGGFGVWSLGLRHPHRFAALAPICGGGRVRDIEAAVANQPDALRSLGVWAFHGARDRVVPLEETARMIDGLRRAGVPDVTFTIYADGEHDAWSASYLNPAFYPWLLQHSR